MNILGQLPASNSERGELNKVDKLKVLRMGIVTVGSYIAIAVVQALLGDLSNGTWGIPQELTAPLTLVLSLALETLRRTVALPPKD